MKDFIRYNIKDRPGHFRVWLLVVFFLPVMVPACFHISGNRVFTVKGNVYVSGWERTETENPKIYVLEGTLVHNLAVNSSVEIVYAGEPASGSGSGQLLVKERNPGKGSWENTGIRDKKPDVFQIIPSSKPPGSLASGGQSQQAVLPLVLKRQKTDAAEFHISGIPGTFDHSPRLTAPLVPFDVTDSIHREKYITRPPPSVV